MIPGMNEMLAHAAELGVETVVLGMPHRGRLNTLANIMRKPLDHLFNDFHPSWSKTDEGSGDVKYHLGASTKREFPSSGKSLSLSMASNPSHLEAVNPSFFFFFNFF
jgi:2-oxoglutarate dehydrogenase E1 component